MDTTNFYVYKASAGSGKTFHLAVSYLRICLQHYPQDAYIFRKILCITFTNKAVNEMKDRILYFLQCLATEPGQLDGKQRRQRENLLPHLTDIASETEIRKRADAVWKHILADYSRFSVLTIDKFYQRLMNAFAFELGLPANHRLELDEQLFTRQMADMLLAKLGHDGTLTDFVLQYLHHRLDGQQKWNPSEALSAVARELYRDETFPYEPVLELLRLDDFNGIIRKMKAERKQLETELRQLAETALKHLPEGVDACRDFAQATKGFGAWLKHVAEGDVEKAFFPNSYVHAAVRDGKWTSGKASASVRASIEGAVPQLTAAYEEICRLAEAKKSMYFLYANLLKNIYPFALLSEFQQVAEEIRESTQQMLIGETNRCIARVVLSEDVPFIYEQLGERYAYFFIDEFQDTSRLQWQNLLPLVNEALSKNVSPTGECGKAALFGDAKQAIYRFRDGDVRQFVHLSRLDKDGVLNRTEEGLKQAFELRTLDRNFRSREEIVHFNNAYFQAVGSGEGVPDILASAYEKPEQQLPGNAGEKKGGGVELCLFDASSGEGSYEDFVLYQTGRIVQQLCEEGYAFRDMAVLTRSNKLASAVAVMLSQQGVPVVSSESLLLNASPEVRFMMACLCCVSHPGHEVARAQVLLYLSERQPGNPQPDAVLSSAKKSEDFSAQLREWGYAADWKELQLLNLYERFCALCGIFRLWKTDGPSDAYLMALGEEVWAFHEDATRTDEDFLDYWEENRQKLSLSNPEGLNAVQVMTVHKAKGLAFPVVIYPMKSKGGSDCVRRWIPLSKPVSAGNSMLDVAYLEIGKDLENTEYADLYTEEKNLQLLDNLNKDYVAFTRPEERLYLLAKKGRVNPSVAEFLSNVCGIEPQEVQGVSGASLYHYPKGETFASPVKNQEADAEAGFCLKSTSDGMLPPLAFSASAEESPEEAVRGTLIHEYLSSLYRLSDVEVLRQRLRRDAFLNPEDAAFMEKLLDSLLSQPEAACLFGGSDILVRNEVSVSAPDGGLYRFDRLLLKGKSARLFDYKTGRPHASHRTQVETYVRLLREMGYAETAAYLVYITGDAAVEFVEVQVFTSDPSRCRGGSSSLPN